MLYTDSEQKKGVRLNFSDNTATFTVMHQDKPLFDVNEKEGITHVYEENKHLLPFSLRAKNEIKYNDYYKWASNRTLSIARENAKAILKSCELSQTDRYEIARNSRLLSVDDCFWIKEKPDEKWEDFDVRKIPISESLSVIALYGSYVSLRGDITTPETCNNGSFPQCWKKQPDGNLYLYKKSKNNYESEKEVLASHILDLMGVEHVRYRMDSTYGEQICCCKCMTNEQSRVTYDEFMDYCSDKGISPMNYLDEYHTEQLSHMFIVDYLISNVDRHMNNWGLYFDNETGEITGIHPLFDHNMAFSDKYNENEIFSYQLQKTNKELALIAQREYKLDLSKLKSPEMEQKFKECHADYRTFCKKCDILQRVAKLYDRSEQKVTPAPKVERSKEADKEEEFDDFER